MPPLRIAGIVLMSVGGAALITGGAFAGVASGNESDLEGSDQLEDRRDTIDKGERNALVADVMLIGGGAIALTGVVLLAVSFRKKNSGSRASVAPSFGPRSAGITARVRF